MNTPSDHSTESKGSSEKKCPSCGKWTRWSLHQDDLCLHCGSVLSSFLKEKEERAIKMKSYTKGLFPLKETDRVILKIGKQTINVLHFIFTAVVSFIVWFITFVVA